MLALHIERVQPVCRHFGHCGTCAIEHLERGAYLAWKRTLVEAAFRQRGIAAAVLRDRAGADDVLQEAAMVALGDPASKDLAKLDSPEMGQRGSGARIPFEESGFKNEAGAVGLSTLPRDKNSGDSQFYMLLAPSRFLDGNYTVFGRVVAGMDVLNKIEKGDLVIRATIVEGR